MNADGEGLASAGDVTIKVKRLFLGMCLKGRFLSAFI